MDTGFIDHGKIYECLENRNAPELSELKEILQHAKDLKGISFEEAERLLMVEKKDHLELVFETANF